MRIAPFTVDITPPLGYPLAYSPNDRVDSKIFVRGVVLDHGSKRVVLAAADVIGLYGPTYHLWRRTIAAAARVPVQNVLIHSVHQHDSLRPITEEIATKIAHLPDAVAAELAFSNELPRRVGAGIRAAMRPGKRGSWQNVDAVGSVERRLSGLASNRRLIKDGKVWAMRWSMNTRPELWREPVGRIDPLLRTIGFFGARGRLLSTLHFYATHPMGAYGRRAVSTDIPGVALSHLEKKFGDVHHAYFTGCAGDITFGKYTHKTKEENLRVLGKRLGDGLIANAEALQADTSPELKATHAPLKFPLDKRRCYPARYAKELARQTSRYPAVWQAHWEHLTRNWSRFSPANLTLLTLGERIHMLSLPAETVVAYQLYAQSLAPEHFLACAAYGDGTLHYICTDDMFREGGYEPEVSLVPRGCEKMYRAAIKSVVSALA